MKKIGNYVFSNCTSLKNATIYSSDAELYPESLGYGEYLSKLEDFTITGYDDSTAEEYAKKYGFEFISMGSIPWSKGDLNHDGVVNVTDISLLAAHVKGVKKLEFASEADLNGDGSINVTDISQLAAHVKGIKKLS